MQYFQHLLTSTAGKVIAVVASLLLVATAVAQIVSYFGGGTPGDVFYTMYICTETGKPFRHRNEMGEMHPIESPYSGRRTGVPAEACYWTADGGTKKEPTWVLLNELAGKSGPTFCPDCGRLVVGHNSAPGPGVRPPPTQTEYASRSGPRETSAQARLGGR
jgi:hypothetical protein